MHANEPAVNVGFATNVWLSNESDVNATALAEAFEGGGLKKSRGANINVADPPKTSGIVGLVDFFNSS